MGTSGNAKHSLCKLCTFVVQIQNRQHDREGAGRQSGVLGNVPALQEHVEEDAAEHAVCQAGV